MRSRRSAEIEVFVQRTAYALIGLDVTIARKVDERLTFLQMLGARRTGRRRRISNAIR